MSFGFWVLGVAARRGMDIIIDFLFVRLLRSVLAGERENESGVGHQTLAERRFAELEMRSATRARKV